MPLDEDYPLTARDFARKLRTVLEADSKLDAKARENLGHVLNSLADKACDLDHLIQRLANDPLSPAQVGELLIALELTLAPLRGYAEDLRGKLFDIGDRLKGIGTAKRAGDALVADPR